MALDYSRGGGEGIPFENLVGKVAYSILGGRGPFYLSTWGTYSRTWGVGTGVKVLM
jgi:hypothetical protein